MDSVSKLTARKIAIIGAGKVGTAIGHILQDKGSEVTAVASRSQESLRRAERFISGYKTRDVVDAAKAADLILVTTNDDQIELVCKTIAQEGGVEPGDVVIHCSGAMSINILEAARMKGAGTCAIHPLQSFATIEGAIEQLPGSMFGVTAQEEILPMAREIVDQLGGELIPINDEDKALYHAAACVASNYFVSLIRFAQSICEDIGIANETAFYGLLPLIKGTLANMELQGTTAALTGPIARGDVGPVKEHLAILESKAPDKLKLYLELGKYTTWVALEKGTIDEKKQQELYTILQGEQHEQESHH
jgi:predicted short-subunit dehydrogenase-like oxidoreductase (DUF2520 family)